MRKLWLFMLALAVAFMLHTCLKANKNIKKTNPAPMSSALKG